MRTINDRSARSLALGAIVQTEDDDDEENDCLLSPAKKVLLARETLAAALRNRHPLELHWRVGLLARPSENGRHNLR